MRKKELIERIENLENALQKEVSLREQTDKTTNEVKEVLDFILEHGKEGVVVYNNFNRGGCWTYSLKYIYKTLLKHCITDLLSCFGVNIEIIKTDNDSIIFLLCDKYYKVDKATATYMAIPEPLFVSKDKEKQTKEKKKNANA